MSCDAYREDLIACLETGTDPSTSASLARHLDDCADCRAALADLGRIRARLAASARAAARPALEGPVMRRVQAAHPADGDVARLEGWLSRATLGARAWRLGLGTIGATVLVIAAAAVFLRAPSQAWSIQQSIEAARPFRALHLRGRFGGGASCELWARSSEDRARSQRLLIRISGGPTIWTDGNATHYFDPGRRIVLTEDAITAGFNPWPGPRLFELARAAGVRMVNTRWRFPNRRTVITEWSQLTAEGPRSARAEFDLDSKLLVSLRQWDNMDRQGTAGFESDDIQYLADLPDKVFQVDLPDGVTFQPKPIEVRESLIGLLALYDAGIETPGLSLEEAGRRIVTEMWQAMQARDVERFKQLCPVARGWSKEMLAVLIMSRDDDPDAVAGVESVEPGSVRGYSRLGPVSVVTSRVRHRDGGLYEAKMIVQHRPGGDVPSCVVYASYGHPYRLE